MTQAVNIHLKCMIGN